MNKLEQTHRVDTLLTFKPGDEAYIWALNLVKTKLVTTWLDREQVATPLHHKEKILSVIKAMVNPSPRTFPKGREDIEKAIEAISQRNYQPAQHLLHKAMEEQVNDYLQVKEELLKGHSHLLEINLLTNVSTIFFILIDELITESLFLSPEFRMKSGYQREQDSFDRQMNRIRYDLDELEIPDRRRTRRQRFEDALHLANCIVLFSEEG